MKRLVAIVVGIFVGFGVIAEPSPTPMGGPCGQTTVEPTGVPHSEQGQRVD